MKKILLLLTISLSLLVLSNKSAYSINELFRSVANGNWTTPSTWQYSTNNGANWLPAVFHPTSAAGKITVYNKVIVDIDVEVDELVVSVNDSIVIGTNKTMIIVNGQGDDLDLSSGGWIVGPGILVTEGNGVLFNFGYGGYGNINSLLKIQSGTTTFFCSGSYNATIYGDIEIASSATFIIVTSQVSSCTLLLMEI